ncbi:SIS domain-containing protein [Alphaproteobacteria bacterium]|nr:SIS domain-containing protein [Alphaproteobacteria bacterium]
MNFSTLYLNEAAKIASKIDTSVIEDAVRALNETRNNNGRLFIVGVGGSAGNASHAVNDFRKIAEIESYCPSDNVSELTARTNDEGFAKVYSSWLKLSKISSKDVLLVLSVGGGNEEKGVSICLIEAIKVAKQGGAKVMCICGKDQGYAQEHADYAMIVPVASNERITPHAEEFQAVLWHLIVSHPEIKKNETTWESIDQS